MTDRETDRQGQRGRESDKGVDKENTSDCETNIRGGKRVGGGGGGGGTRYGLIDEKRKIKEDIGTGKSCHKKT